MASAHAKGVVDLTFLEIKDESGISLYIESRNPNNQTQLLDTSTSLVDTSGSQSSTRRLRRKKEEIKAVRLSNNIIQDMSIICAPIKASPSLDLSLILWLDLSFNHMINLCDLVSLFPNLTTIYLHANRIKKMSEVRKLSTLPSLKSLSLYGNPVEEHKHYRNYILFMCPGLTQFDSSPVTRADRERVDVWSNTFRKFLTPQED